MILLLLLLFLAPAPPPLHLEATAARSEIVRGEVCTVSSYLFNDGTVDTAGEITIAAPAGLFALTPERASGDIPPGRALRLDVRYQVAADAPLGLAAFVVSGGGQRADVVIRIGPIESAPPQRPPIWRVYLPVIR